MKYTFTGMDVPGILAETIVEAPDEAEARHLAMVARWGQGMKARAPSIGPSADILRGKYAGAGLYLVKCE